LVWSSFMRALFQPSDNKMAGFTQINSHREKFIFVRCRISNTI
jgi:hypothetical protein